MIKEYDVLILGGGPAGLTASIYAQRYGLKSLVISKVIGGTANLAGELENWPGYLGSGLELMNKIKTQAESFGGEFFEGEIKLVKKEEGLFHVEAGDEVFKSSSMIIALGTENRKLDVPGEKEFLGKGVSYCATCDGNFFREKEVVVIGGADSAAKAALYLSAICKKVTVVYRKHEMRCEPVSLQKICKTPNIEIVYYSIPKEILGDSKVSGIRILTEKKEGEISERIISADGIFIEIGAKPAIDLMSDMGIDFEGNYIVTDKGARTNVKGIFAAGDITNNEMKQMITSSAEGAIAAKGVHEYLMDIRQV